MSSDRRDLNNGFGDALATPFELVVTPVVFGFVGWFLDSPARHRPGLTVALASGSWFRARSGRLARLHRRSAEEEKLARSTTEMSAP